MGGSSAQKATDYNPALGSLQSSVNAQQNPAIRNLLSQVSSGNMSISDALRSTSGMGMSQGNKNADKIAQLQSQRNAPWSGAALNPMGVAVGLMARNGDLDEQIKQLQAEDSQNQSVDLGSIARDALATDPIIGSMMAKDAVMNDPTLAGLYGDGGLMSQAEGQYGIASNDLTSDRNALMGRDESYGLTNQDLKAYGQASDNIARLFGTQENSLSQALADRGLGAAPSGAANQAFSNLYGNKFEQLAGMQNQIAQNRINTAMNLAQARTHMDLQRQAQAGALSQGLGVLGQNAITNQFNRQLQGAENNYNKQAGAAGMTMQNQQLQQGINDSQWNQQQASSFNPGQWLGGIVSNAAGSFAGGYGSGLGYGASGAGKK